MKVAIYPGSFDPVTNGHLDIIERSARLCDKLVIAVAVNIAKKPLFTVEERVEMLSDSIKDIHAETEVVTIDSLLVDYCRENKISFIVRGLRSITDFEYEMTIAQVNKKLAPELDTVFMMATGENFFISSNIVKEISKYEGDIRDFVPQPVADKLLAKQSVLQ
jgi:pantetheine-phosphate adenylyltransferase